MKLITLMLLASSGWAQNLIAPVAGILVNAQGRAVAVCGISSTLMPPRELPLHVEGPALSAAFNGNGGAVKTQNLLILLDAAGSPTTSESVPAGPAVLSLAQTGAIAWLWYPSQNQLLNHATGQAIDTSPFADEVVAIGPATGSFLPILVRSGAQLISVQLAISTAAIVSQSVVAGSAPAIAYRGGWLVTTQTGLQLLSLDGQSVLNEIPLAESATALTSAGFDAAVINGHLLLNAAGNLLAIPSLHRTLRSVRQQ